MGSVIALVGLEVLGQVAYSLREHGNLNLGRSRIGVRPAVVRDDFRFGCGI